MKRKKGSKSCAREVQQIRRRIYGELKRIGITSIDSKPLSGCKNKDLFLAYKENFDCDESSLKSMMKALRVKNKLDKKTSVYFIGNLEAGFVKIGYSDNPSKRLKQLRTGCPFPIDIIHCVETDEPRTLEKKIHSIFKSSRCQGEWFKVDEKFENYLSNIV